MQKKLNILHIDPEKKWGGGEAQVLGLTTYLHRGGHQSVVAGDPYGLLLARLSEHGLPRYPLRVRNHLDLLAGFRLRRLVQAGGYQIVHFHTARAHALSPWLRGLPAKRLVTRRMDYPIFRGRRTRLLYEQSVDIVIAISQSVEAALLAGGVPSARIRRIPSGIETTRYLPNEHVRRQIRATLGIEPHEHIVLTVGALTERKGHGLLFSAAYMLQEQGIRLRYVICGEGSLRASLESQVRTLGLQDVVHFMGFTPDIPRYLAAADILVHVPSWEGLGVAVIEALAAGLPVIASRVGGIPDLIDDQVTGLLVPPQDAAALAVAIERLVHNPQWAKTLGTKGQAFVQAQFDVSVMAQANESLYNELLSEVVET
jgi:glycosyltransferase involved in cell wall biosynthesis